MSTIVNMIISHLIIAGGLIYAIVLGKDVLKSTHGCFICDKVRFRFKFKHAEVDSSLPLPRVHFCTKCANTKDPFKISRSDRYLHIKIFDLSGDTPKTINESIYHIGTDISRLGGNDEIATKHNEVLRRVVQSRIHKDHNARKVIRFPEKR